MRIAVATNKMAQSGALPVSPKVTLADPIAGVDDGVAEVAGVAELTEAGVEIADGVGVGNPAVADGEGVGDPPVDDGEG